jgi:hypothetical protein
MGLLLSAADEGKRRTSPRALNFKADAVFAFAHPHTAHESDTPHCSPGERRRCGMALAPGLHGSFTGIFINGSFQAEERQP